MQADKVKLSVIIPVYNSCNFIEDCVAGVIKANIPDMEIILVDDGSTDGSNEICTGLGKKDPRVRAFRKKNGGSASARNYGLERAYGEYVGFIDSDDTIDSKGYAEVFLSAYNRQTDISCFAMTNEEYGTISVPEGYKGNIWELFINKPVYMHSVCNKFFKREIIEGMRFDEDLVVCEDMLFCARAILKAATITYCDMPVYKYRADANSVTHATNAVRQSRDDIEAADRLRLIGTSQNSNLDRLIAFRHQIAGLRFLIEPSCYSKEAYNLSVIDKKAYRDLPNWKHRALCWCANHKLYLVPELYIRLKRVKYRV